MTISLRPYSEYKDSGLSLLDTIPRHWEIKRLKSWIDLNSSVLSEDTPPDFEMDYIDIGAIGTGGLVGLPQRFRFKDAPSRARRILKRGDTIVSTVRTYLRAIHFVSDPPDNLICSTGFAVLSPRQGIDPKFVTYLAHSNFFTDQITAQSVGIAYPAISEGKLAACHALVPPREEQAAIVRFLDHADQKIRRFIQAKRRLIELLSEQKQAITHHYVTRSIDSSVPLKPSGLDWLGEIPEHWTIRKIGHFASVGNGSTPSRSKMAYWINGTFPWLNSASVNAGLITEANQFVTDLALRECHLPRVQPGSVLIAITGQGKTRGTTALLAIEATINQHIAFIRPRRHRKNATHEYLKLFLISAYSEIRRISDGSGSTKGALTCNDLRHFKVALPPIEEQDRIVFQTQAEIREAEEAIRIAQHEIDLIREYRNRLITDVVTGKLDVRAAAERLLSSVEQEVIDDESLGLSDLNPERAESLDDEATDLISVADED